MFYLPTLTNKHSYGQNIYSYVFCLTKILKNIKVECIYFVHLSVLLMRAGYNENKDKDNS